MLIFPLKITILMNIRYFEKLKPSKIYSNLRQSFEFVWQHLAENIQNNPKNISFKKDRIEILAGIHISRTKAFQNTY